MLRRLKKRNSPKYGSNAALGSDGVATPDAVLQAAEAAPRVFNIADYYQAVRLMREKGHSWRDLASWLKQFKINVSFAHLRRLYVQEDKRLSKLNERQLRELGMPEELIEEFVSRDEKIDRLAAADPEDEDTEGKDKRR
jgi:hypothetical protein